MSKIGVGVLCITLMFAVAALAKMIIASPAQSVGANGSADSCAVFHPKAKAIGNAESSARANAIAKCTVSDADCKSQCAAEGYNKGTKYITNASYSTAVVTRGTSCGWHAETHVSADCSCNCSN